MIIGTYAEIIGNSRNIKHYKSFGYPITVGIKIKVKVKHLTKMSKATIDVKCDFCTFKTKTTFQNYAKHTDDCTSEYYCIKCSVKKIEKTN